MKKINFVLMVLLMVIFMSPGVFANNNESQKTQEVNVRNINAQAQGQIQGQAQSMNNGQSISPSQSIDIDTPRDAVDAIQINAINIPLYQNGTIGDITSTMANFKGLKKLSNLDIIVKVLKVEYGNVFSRIKLQDLESKIVSTKIVGDKIRYSVKFKGSVSGFAVGGGAGAARSSTDALTTASGSILPGYADSTHDPKFIITYYEVE
jgi:hypothetical protein